MAKSQTVVFSYSETSVMSLALTPKQLKDLHRFLCIYDVHLAILRSLEMLSDDKSYYHKLYALSTLVTKYLFTHNIFKDCISAINGTIVLVSAPSNKQNVVSEVNY
ncbi:hypothetical protein Pfo_031345 [Paulownia fortunei]|nr:hypothetical protein Pfo_031345 [Paulownia fortunei]